MNQQMNHRNHTSQNCKTITFTVIIITKDKKETEKVHRNHNNQGLLKVIEKVHRNHNNQGLSKEIDKFHRNVLK